MHLKSKNSLLFLVASCIACFPISLRKNIKVTVTFMFLSKEIGKQAMHGATRNNKLFLDFKYIDLVKL